MAIIDKFKKKTKKEEIDVKAPAMVKAEKETKAVKKDGEWSSVKYHDFLRAPYITEKTAMLGTHNKYAFKVPEGANKIEIKKAVEKIFDVSVLSVSVMNVPGKKVRLGYHMGRKPGFKKAIVQLKEGDKIDVGI